MTIKKFRKDIDAIKGQIAGQLPDENEITYEIYSQLADENPKLRKAIKKLADYLATNPNIYKTIDERPVKLEALKPNTPEIIQYKKLYKTYINTRKEAIHSLSDENLKKTLLEYGFTPPDNTIK